MTNKRELMLLFDALREKKGYSKKEVADEIGIEPSYYSNWLKRGMPLSRLEDLALAIGVQPNDILGAGGGGNFVTYCDKPLRTWLTLREASENTIVFITSRHRDWMFAEIDHDAKLVNVSTRRAKISDIVFYAQATGRLMLCLQLNVASIEKIRQKRATALDFFGVGDAGGWASQADVVTHDSPYMLALKPDAAASTAPRMSDPSDAAAVERILQAATRMDSVDIDYFADIMELRIESEASQRGRMIVRGKVRPSKPVTATLDGEQLKKKD